MHVGLEKIHSDFIPYNVINSIVHNSYGQVGTKIQQ